MTNKYFKSIALILLILTITTPISSAGLFSDIMYFIGIPQIALNQQYQPLEQRLLTANSQSNIAFANNQLQKLGSDTLMIYVTGIPEPVTTQRYQITKNLGITTQEPTGFYYYTTITYNQITKIYALVSDGDISYLDQVQITDIIKFG